MFHRFSIAGFTWLYSLFPINYVSMWIFGYGYGLYLHLLVLRMPDTRIARRLEAVFNEQKKASVLASTATGFIMSICFFFLPLMWSSLFHLLPVPATSTCSNDPWSGITDL